MSLWLNRCLTLGLAAVVVTGLQNVFPAPEALPQGHWVKAGKVLSNRASKKDTLLLNNGGSTEGIDILRDQQLKPLLALPEPRGRVQQLWVLGRRSHLPAGLNDFTAIGSSETVAPGLTLFALKRPGGTALWRATDMLETADIRVGKIRCEGRHAAGKRCSGLPDWMRITREEVTVGGQRRTCLWAHPPANGAFLTVDFGAVPEGELLIRHGLSDRASESENNSPVELRILSDAGERLLRAHNKAGFQSERLEVRGRLKLKIRAKKDGMRHYCFKAEIR